MAEMALAAFNAAGSALSGLTAALPSVSTMASVLGGVATAGSVLMQLNQASSIEAAGRAASQEAAFNATLASLEGERQSTESEARALKIREDALKRQAAARVAFAASGLDISSRQLGNIENDLQSDADYGLALEKGNRATARADAATRSGQYELQSLNAERSAAARARAARLGAASEGAKGLLSIIRRG